MLMYFNNKYNIKIIYFNKRNRSNSNFIRLYRGKPIELKICNEKIASFADFLPIANSVQSIMLYDCVLDDLSALIHFKKLKELYISGTFYSKRFCHFLQLPFLEKLTIWNYKYPEKEPFVYSLAEAYLPLLKSLSIGGFETNSLNGVHFPSLCELDIEKSHCINSLKGANIPLLKKLEATESIRKIDIKLPKLKSLYISFKDFDFYSLKNTPNLRDLYGYNFDEHQTLEGLEECKKLKSLEVLESPFTNFTPFAKLKSLELLDVQYSKIESLIGLEQMSHLKKLYMFYNPIKEIEDINPIKKLELIAIEKHKLTKIQQDIKKLNIRHLMLG